ncbi:MAG: vanadium-dependent haloperoxidase [Cyanobacteria bacterium J06554_3]
MGIKGRLLLPLMMAGFSMAGATATVAKAADFKLSNPDPVLRWNEATLEAISRTKIAPTSTARAIALTSTSMYDAWAAYDATAIGTQFGDTLQISSANVTDTNKQTAISYAAYRTLSNLFPQQQSLFDTLMADMGYDSSITTTQFATGLNAQTEAAVTGNLAAQALLDFRATDGSNQANDYASTISYQPANTWDKINNPERWQPISIDNGVNIQENLTPHWNQVTPFALKSADQFLPPAPKPLLDSNGDLNKDFVDQSLEVIRYSAELTDEEKVIAEYWADGPRTVLPPGHWQVFGQYVSQRDNLSLDENVKLFFGLGNAVFDASISSWDAKVHYDYARPISTIRYLAANNLLPTDDPNVRINADGKTEIYAWGGPEQGSQWILGTDWLPYQDITFLTPPFAEYVSGHSTFSAAAAEVLLQYTGSDNFGLCHVEPANSSTFESNTPDKPVELCWDTFTAAADEAGLSRLYGGIHFTDGDVNGRAMGREIGEQVWAKSQFYINGGKSAAVPEPGMIAGLVFSSVLVWRKRK